MNTREAILTALRDGGDRGVSGEQLARVLGISRAAVGKHVASLRDHGYVVDATAGAGYVLVSIPDLPLPEEVARHLGTAFWGRLHGGGETSSTNDDAKALARSGAPEGTAVLASSQTGGRGRFAREWASPPGGVYLSAVLRPPLAVADAAPLPLVLALGASRGLEETGVSPGLKWPNDLVLGGAGGESVPLRKLAGVLVEVSAEAEALEWAVVGVGVNVHRTQIPSHPDAAYVADVLGEDTPALAKVAAAVLEGMEGAYLAFLAQGFSGALASEYEARWVLGGRDVSVSDPRGTLVASGTAVGLDEYGRLVVKGADGGTTTVSAGDVTLRTGGR